VIGNIAVFVNRVAPVFVKMYATAFHYFRMLPQDLMMVVFGLALCFFGGVYPAAIAAVEVGAVTDVVLCVWALPPPPLSLA